jgi:hypothetical protein
MTELEKDLEAARGADPSSRILLRDQIAAHGDAAIGPMASWVVDARLGAFAVRVLERIAVDPARRGAIVAALASVNRQRLSPEVAGDVVNALTRLRPARAPRRLAAERPETFRLSRDGPAGSTTEERFHDAMLDIYWLAGRATGYWASYFLRSVRNNGGRAAARELLRKSGTSPGFLRLTAEGRLDLSMEALVLMPEFSALFTPAEVEIALGRLVAAGYATGTDRHAP